MDMLPAASLRSRYSRIPILGAASSCGQAALSALIVLYCAIGIGTNDSFQNVYEWDFVQVSIEF